MSLPVKIALLVLSLTVGLFCLSCGPLPRSRNFYGSLDKWPLSARATGLVFAATDVSYTSTDFFFYNFASGELSPLALGESGDPTGKWDGSRFWLFNRAAGRVSYSSLSPKSGSTSRTTERRTPDANISEPSDWLHVSDAESFLALGAAGKVAVANLASGVAIPTDLGDVDTSASDVPFRPGYFARHDKDIAVFHQSLTRTWSAKGAGKVFIARRGSSGTWGWADQDVTVSGFQGVPLNISDPVATFNCNDKRCLIAGACYELFGESCVGGVDELTWATRSVRHIFDWPRGSLSAGHVAAGVTSAQLIACLKNPSDANAKLVVIDALTGIEGSSWDAGAATCGPFTVDPDGHRIFAVRYSADGSLLYALNPDLTEIAHVNLNVKVSALEMVNE